MNRREFIQRLGVIAACAAIPVAVIESAVKAASIPANTGDINWEDTFPSPSQIHQALTFEMLENAYQGCSYGMEHPTLIVMPPKDWQSTRRMFCWQQRVVYQREKKAFSFMYNDADVVMAPDCGGIYFINEGQPNNPKLNSFIRRTA